MQRAKHWPVWRPAIDRLSVAAHPEVWPALTLLGLYGVLYVQFALQLAGTPFDLDQGEGYDAWSAWLINVGQLPYTDNAAYPYYSSNYPPLWSYLVSIPMAWLGPGLGPARVVSSACALASAAVIGLAARRLSGRRLAGWLAAGFFIASPYVFHTTPLARVNSLALLGALLGLSLFEQPTRVRVVLGSLAFLAALFTKPTAVDAVVAGVLALAPRRPKSSALAGALIAGLGLIGLGGLVFATRGAFWLNVVSGNANPLDFGQLWSYLANFSVVHCVCLAMAIAECVWLSRRRDLSPWAVYAIVAAVAALSVAKWGAGESYFLGVIAAISVLSAAWIARFLDSSPPRRLRIGLGIALAIQALLLSHAAVSDAVPWLPDRGPQGAFLGRAPTPEDELAAQSIADQIKSANGPVLSEDPSFAVMAGRPLVGNATHLRNLHQAGLWDPQPLVREVKDRKYAIIVLDAELYPEPVLAAIGQSYFLDRSVRINGATYHIFLPGTQ